MESIKELKEICQKQKTLDKKFASAFGYLFHRRISIYITKFFLTVFPEIKPNAVGAMMIAFSLAGVVAIAFGASYGAQIIGIVLVYFGFLLDKVDGEIARYKKMFPLRGMYLDEIYHAAVPSALMFGFLHKTSVSGTLESYLLALLVYFVLLNRHGRKIWLVIYAKNENKIRNKEIAEYSGNNFMAGFFNMLPFKILSVLERFDLVILSVFIVLLAENFYGLSGLRFYYLYGFLGLNVLYFVRWFFLNYFGGIDRTIKDISEKGY